MSHLETKKLAVERPNPRFESLEKAARDRLTKSIDSLVKVSLGIADVAPFRTFITELEHVIAPIRVSVVPTLAQLSDLTNRACPAVIFLDSDLLGGRPICDSLIPFSEVAPVVILASSDSQSQLANLVATGNVDFVARAGDFAPLACALIVRRLKWLQQIRSASAPQGAISNSGMGEIFRHEINNPLTGILGNIEMLLAHREHLSSLEIERLQTVVSLAIRLRESIRRLTNSWGNLPVSKSI